MIYATVVLNKRLLLSKLQTELVDLHCELANSDEAYSEIRDGS